MRGFLRFVMGNTAIVDTFGLLLSIIVIHTIYMLVIDPAASEALFQAGQAGEAPPRTLAVILKDLEQEICLILGMWCLWLWLFRYQLLMDEPHLLSEDFLDLNVRTKFDEETLDDLRKTVSDKLLQTPHLALLANVRITLNALSHDGPDSQFKEARDVGTESCELYLEQLDSKLSLTKYILWAIPSVGFLGTVRGIGEALGKAGEALAGDITGVAASLGVAFNSTFCALFVSLVLMFVSYVLQGREEKMVAAYKNFIANELIAKLSSLANVSIDEHPLAIENPESTA